MPQLFCNFFCSCFSPKHRSICGVSFCTCRIQSSRTHKSQAPSLKSADSNHERRTQELENSLNCLHEAVIPQMNFSTQAVSFQITLKWWCFKMSMKQIQRVNTQKVRNQTLVLTNSEKPLRLPCYKHSAKIILVRSKQDSVPVSHSKQIPQRKENKKRQRHPAQNEKLALLSADFCTQRLPFSTFSSRLVRVRIFVMKWIWNLKLRLQPSIHQPLVTSLSAIDDVHKALSDLKISWVVSKKQSESACCPPCNIWQLWREVHQGLHQ